MILIVFGVASYQPKGFITEIGDIKVYTVAPVQVTDETSTLLLLPDGFGLATHNIILSDKFASHGWLVFLPDYYEGDPLPEALLGPKPTVVLGECDRPSTANAPAVININAWLNKHNHSRVGILLQQLVANLQAQRPAAILQGVGYCFGGKHVLRLAKQSLQAAVAFHPSYVEEEDCKDIKSPLYVGLAGDDEMVPATLHQDLISWVQQSPSQLEFTIESYEGMLHGFAARPNTKDAAMKTEFERAFDRTVNFLQKYQWGL
ncbi:hypothetical protein AU210_012536 [Fusarium oxysporum f. sp. radicis-cucumerinum]|uniref:Dienelactone hydrolase domain-containing protein n=1 Tax=Fusarium oxysporum f. sp. radicis-cucumerinum TaxID=327505 RepID=A0A2H3GHE1_FUSOX|nr:hypothetical protein AU210_012536 [Fusarium oxysporum f. sp. radicis-cucumerinum]RKK35971.1 hypothetical protein BFJ66_g13715 [Fusarium oxysporum f. sp. cepae]RKK81749.1 hypothetical protein BFJ71_g15500 [Fusarium oxysporum]